MKLYFFLALAGHVAQYVLASKPEAEHCEPFDDVNLFQRAVSVRHHPTSTRDAHGMFAFAFLFFGNSSDQLVSARALVKGLRANGAHSDMVAIVPLDNSPPEKFIEILADDGVRIMHAQPLSTLGRPLARWQSVMTKLTIFSMTQYVRVALLDLDIVIESGAVPESIFLECKGFELCAVSDAEPKMLNAGVMLVHPSQARYMDLVEKIKLDAQNIHNDTFPEQAFLQRYAEDPANTFTWSELPEKYNSCSQGGWLLNTGDARSGFQFIHGCSWGAKMCNMQLCSAAPELPCRHSVKLFQLYHRSSDPCIAHSALKHCNAVSSCAWCGHYCSNRAVECSNTLFATADNPDKHEIQRDNPTFSGLEENQTKHSLMKRPGFFFASLPVHKASATASGTSNEPTAAPKPHKVLQSKALYYAMIDRVATPEGHRAPRCTSLDDYCGGTVAGLEAQIPYLKELGVDGVLISPLLKNVPKGYHGYWTQSLNEMNSHFGSVEDVSFFVHSANGLGMYVVGDLNLNHFGKGIEDLPNLSPFNKSEYFHDCTPCNSDCSIGDYNNEQQTQQCRLFGMPDLNQDLPEVRHTLKQFVRRYVDRFGFEALRLDAARHLPGSFVDEIAEGAGSWGGGRKKPIPVLPEMYSDDVKASSKLSRDRTTPTMNYPLFLELRSAFGNGTSMRKLQQVQHDMVEAVPEPHLLVNFVNTHDVPRFLALQPDVVLYSNALVFTLCNVGVPMILYGDEQDIQGGTNPNNANEFRVPLWHKDFRNRKSPRFRMIQTLLHLRPKFTHEPYRLLHLDDQTLVFARGQYIFVTSNFGSRSRLLPAQRVVYVSDTASDLCNIKSFCDELTKSTTGCLKPEDAPEDHAAYSSRREGYANPLGVACILRVDVSEDGMPRVYAPVTPHAASENSQTKANFPSKDEVSMLKIPANVTLLTVHDLRQQELKLQLGEKQPAESSNRSVRVSVGVPLEQFRRPVPLDLWHPSKFLTFSGKEIPQELQPEFDNHDWWPPTSHQYNRYVVLHLPQGCAFHYGKSGFAFLNQKLTDGGVQVVCPSQGDELGNADAGCSRLTEDQQNALAQLQAEAQDMKHARAAQKRIWFLTGKWTGFYHTIVDFLPHLVALGVLEELKSGKAHAILPQNEAKHVIKKYLEHLGVNTDSQVMFVPHGDMRCASSELLVPSGAWSLELVPREPVELLRDRFLPECLSLACKKERVSRFLVYVSRRDANHRRVANETNVLQALKAVAHDFGLILVDFAPSEHSIAETVRIFSQARLVAGAHGAGLANLIHAQSGTDVIEILPVVPDMVNAHYWHLANALRLDYRLHAVEVPAASLVEGEMGTLTVKEFHVDVPRLASIARKALDQDPQQGHSLEPSKSGSLSSTDFSDSKSQVVQDSNLDRLINLDRLTNHLEW